MRLFLGVRALAVGDGRVRGGSLGRNPAYADAHRRRAGCLVAAEHTESSLFAALRVQPERPAFGTLSAFNGLFALGSSGLAVRQVCSSSPQRSSTLVAYTFFVQTKNTTKNASASNESRSIAAVWFVKSRGGLSARLDTIPRIFVQRILANLCYATIPRRLLELACSG